MFLNEYGNWLELIDDQDRIRWITLESLPTANLRNIKLILEHSSGEPHGGCWLTYNSKPIAINNSYLVVDKESEVNAAVLRALKSSRKYGGGIMSVGCLETPND